MSGCPVRPFHLNLCGRYSFKRQLKETERETVKRYTCRVRVLSVMYPHFDPESLADLCLSSMTDPLFPNIRRLYFFITGKTLPLTHHIIVPELRRLFLQFGVSNISSCESHVQLLGLGCPNLKMTQITPFSTLVALDEIMNRHIRRWIYLQEVDCSTGISFDIDTLSSFPPARLNRAFVYAQPRIDRSNRILQPPACLFCTANNNRIDCPHFRTIYAHAATSCFA